MSASFFVPFKEEERWLEDRVARVRQLRTLAWQYQRYHLFFSVRRMPEGVLITRVKPRTAKMVGKKARMDPRRARWRSASANGAIF